MPAEDQITLLADAFETGDARTIIHALNAIARARGIAMAWNLGGDDDPRLSTLLGMVRTLGFQLSAKPLPESATVTEKDAK